MSSSFPDGFSFQRRTEKKLMALRPWLIAGLALAAILFQVYVPLFFPFLGYLELPLLVVVYFALLRRSQLAGIVIGATIGLVQDSLSHHWLGMFGMVKTLVGYFAGSMSMRFAVDHPAVRFGLIGFFVIFHQTVYWVLNRALLGEALPLDLPRVLLLGLLNAFVGVPLFLLFDKLMLKG